MDQDLRSLDENSVNTPINIFPPGGKQNCEQEEEEKCAFYKQQKAVKHFHRKRNLKKPYPLMSHRGRDLLCMQVAKA